MEILKKAFVSDGFAIQLEDWSKDGSPFPATIAAYPKEGWRNHFRAEVDFNTKDEAEAAFESLCNGGATVFDFVFTVMVSGGIRVPMMQVLKRE